MPPAQGRRANRRACCETVACRKQDLYDCNCNDLRTVLICLGVSEMAETRTMILSTAAKAATGDHADLRRDVLNGCHWHDVKSMLRDVGLRPTRQRMALGWILFAKVDRHLTAEMLYEEATKAKVPVSLATVYNTLHQFTDVGLLRQVAVDGSKTYFDTNA